jgi:transposase
LAAAVPGSWKNVTLITGLRVEGVVAPQAVIGATNQPVFETYVTEVLVPELKAGDVVIWDNLKPHKNPAVIEAVEAVGARVMPLPVYSPDLTPIEEMFSKVKAYLRTVAARTTGAVGTALYEALERVTPSDILGWFSDRCAYAMPL